MKRIINVHREIVRVREQAYWSFCIEYTDEQDAKKHSSGKKPKIDYREVLSEKDFAVFSKLRELRKEIADKEGLQLFHIFTNEQLAEIARNNPNTKAAMSKIKGVGEATLEKYAEPFIERLKDFEGEASGKSLF